MKGCAVITGAGGGIGAAIALALARMGRRLVLVDLSQPDLEQTRAACVAAGAYAEVISADVTCEEQVVALVTHASRQPGGVDGFVTAAGIPGVVEAVSSYSVDVFRQVLEVNVVGTFLCMKHGLPAMQGGGSFVAIGSTSSIRGRAHLAGYVASKHAVLGLVRTAALEHVATAIRVNAILPGPTQTTMIDQINDMASRRTPDGGRVERAVRAPVATPAQVADTAVFLLSSTSQHLNGSTIVVDGGSTLA